MRAAQELGYQPSAAARNLRRLRTNKIGLVVTYPIHRVSDFLSELIPAMATVAEEAEYSLILYASMVGRVERIKSLCRSREVDGIIIAWPPRLSETVALSQLLTDEDMPQIFLPCRVPHSAISYVAADHVQGALQLTQHLIAMGQRRIGFKRLPEIYESDDDRHAGYDGIPSSGVTEPALTTVRQSTAQMGVLAVESLLKSITDGGAESQQHILPVEFIVRGSTGQNVRA